MFEKYTTLTLEVYQPSWYLFLCCPYTENFALGKATLQSSTFNNTQLGVSGVSEKAVDGNSDTEFWNGSCAHTQSSYPSWWRVDLGSDKVPVSDIFIVNRFSSITSLMARSKNYNITLGEQSLYFSCNQYDISLR